MPSDLAPLRFRLVWRTKSPTQKRTRSLQVNPVHRNLRSLKKRYLRPLLMLLQRRRDRFGGRGAIGNNVVEL